MCVILCVRILVICIISGVFRKYCSKTAESHIKIESKKVYGQPHYETHPHLLKEGEITPLIKKTEFQSRRDKLIDSLLKSVTCNDKENKHRNHVVGI